MGPFSGHQALKGWRYSHANWKSTDNKWSLTCSKVSWKFLIPTIYNFGVNFQWNLPFFKQVAYFSTASIAFSVYKQKVTAL